MSEQLSGGNGGSRERRQEGGTGGARGAGHTPWETVKRWAASRGSSGRRRVAAALLVVLGLGLGFTLALRPWTGAPEGWGARLAAPWRIGDDVPSSADSGASVARAEPVFVEPAPAPRPVPVETTPRSETPGDAEGAKPREAAAGGGEGRAEALASPDGDDAARATLGFVPPSGAPVVQQRGWHRHPVYKEWRYQPGIELETAPATEVKAAGPGVVSFVGYDARWGLTVKVRHDGGWETAYGYLGDVLVEEDEVLAGGEVIAASGMTPWQEPRLFFGVWKDGAAVDPLPFLPQ